MTIRDSQLNSRRFELDETRRKLRDLADLKRHIDASLERLGPAGDTAAQGNGKADGNVRDRRETLSRSLDEIDQKISKTEAELLVEQEDLNRHELVRNGYDRIPVAVGRGRGRSQIEHIRIVRNPRDERA
jgi:hypothetical protein